MQRRIAGPVAVGRVPHREDAGRRIAAPAVAEAVEPVRLDGEGGVVHAERSGDPFLEHIAEPLGRDPLDEHAEHLGRQVVPPPTARLVLERHRPDDRHQPVRCRHGARGGWSEHEPRRGQRAERQLCGSSAEVVAEAHPEREQVPNRDRPLGGHRLVERRRSGHQHPAIGELGQPGIDRVVEPDPSFVDEHQRSQRGEGLRHRRDAHDRVAPHRATAGIEPAGSADVGPVVGRHGPHRTRRAVEHLPGHGGVELRQCVVVEFGHAGRTCRSGRSHRRSIMPVLARGTAKPNLP